MWRKLPFSYFPAFIGTDSLTRAFEQKWRRVALTKYLWASPYECWSLVLFVTRFNVWTFTSKWCSKLLSPFLQCSKPLCAKIESLTERSSWITVTCHLKEAKPKLNNLVQHTSRLQGSPVCCTIHCDNKCLSWINAVKVSKIFTKAAL